MLDRLAPLVKTKIKEGILRGDDTLLDAVIDFCSLSETQLKDYGVIDIESSNVCSFERYEQIVFETFKELANKQTDAYNRKYGIGSRLK